MALPNFTHGYRLVSGEDLTALTASIAALVLANSVTLASPLPTFQPGPRTHRGESIASLMSAVEAVAAAKSITVPILKRPLPGHRLIAGGDLANIVWSVQALGGS